MPRSGTYTVTLTATNAGGSDGETTTNYIIVGNPPTPPSAQFYFSPQSDGSFGNDEDVAVFDGSGFSVVLDGSALGIGGEDIDAVTILDNGDFLISSTRSVSLGGVSAADEDLLRSDPTSGQWALYFDGSDVGLSSSGEDVDAVHVLSNGHLLVSTQGSYRSPACPSATRTSSSHTHLDRRQHFW